MKQSDNTNSLFELLRDLEVAETNLVKLERLWKNISHMMPTALAYGSPPEYEYLCRSYRFTLRRLTKIDGWCPSAKPVEVDERAQYEFDALKLDETSQTVGRKIKTNKPGTELKKYRLLLNRKRKQVTREAASNLITSVDSLIHIMLQELIYSRDVGIIQGISKERWSKLDEYISQIDLLFGSAERPLLWDDLTYHSRVAQNNNALVIADRVWPVLRLLIMVAIK
ncbi:MAG: hypothetical protein KF862_04050 [Chitinophagaceae bacterium]|nr:hypothetical protein [Chitinophagaceae bacterium]